jgi:hypothetical protein
MLWTGWASSPGTGRPFPLDWVGLFVGIRSTFLAVTPEEILRGQPDVLDDLAEEDRRHLPTTVKGNGGLPAVGMAGLLVGAPLSDLFKSKFTED